MGAELIFITAGMGGGTVPRCSAGSPAARETHALIVAVVTTPFSLKDTSALMMLWPEYPDYGLKWTLDCSTQRQLLRLMSEDASMEEAFRQPCVVTQGIMSISKLVNVPVR